MSALSHDHIVRVVGGCLRPPTMLLVEELCEGGSLHMAIHGDTVRSANKDRATAAAAASASGGARTIGNGDGGLAKQPTGALELETSLQVGSSKTCQTKCGSGTPWVPVDKQENRSGAL